MPRRRATKMAQHASAPKTSHLDSMGRVFFLDDSTGSERVGFPAELDIVCNLRVITDALFRRAFVAECDMCQHRTHYATIEAGSAWSFLDETGATCKTCTARGFRTRLEYDGLSRRMNPGGGYGHSG